MNSLQFNRAYTDQFCKVGMGLDIVNSLWLVSYNNPESGFKVTHKFDTEHEAAIVFIEYVSRDNVLSITEIEQLEQIEWSKIAYEMQALIEVKA